MRTSLLCVFLFSFLLTASAAVTPQQLLNLITQSSPDLLSDPTLVTKFTDFTVQFNKTYSSNTEILTRFTNFQTNMIQATKLTQLSLSSGFANAAKYGVTQFSDLSLEEFRSTYLMPNLPQVPTDILNSPIYNSNSYPNTFDRNMTIGAPASFDWRNHAGAVTGVYNQGNCGSCWAFSATENHESRWGLQHHTGAPNLSVQQILDCDAPSTYGCNGGWPYQAWEYIQSQGGQDRLNCYPYDGHVEGCRYNKGCDAATIVSWSWIGRGDEPGMLNWLYGNAPLSICLDASQWMSYSSGVVLSQYCQRSIDHCVLLTGWNMGTSPPSWNVRNSWGTGWGEAGYIQLQYNADTCGMATYPASCHTCNGC